MHETENMNIPLNSHLKDLVYIVQTEKQLVQHLLLRKYLKLWLTGKITALFIFFLLVPLLLSSKLSI